ncbi:MAG: hypothetical protein CUN49_11295 [Candidatus Thermofonsia Clade 1 bacterium]|jgi:succinate dehydrogenase/fumarate reductase flavoprotein subunit|uniref:Uncharacterized protein n=1 Tax=Candidatus Thermofonsia Clade 1 bacterium TaxID=2364210 RepID=A0A2M8PCM2_9CHLR|nr:MAG: hypothetical protein CUN49_11295 [Candidatus Thermofonsia Clade 1 bacterium]RMF50881.1 MAG: hypothetical protein D6749_09375 [Chloroflexota bacterium]
MRSLTLTQIANLDLSALALGIRLRIIARSGAADALQQFAAQALKAWLQFSGALKHTRGSGSASQRRMTAHRAARLWLSAYDTPFSGLYALIFNNGRFDVMETRHRSRILT